MKKIIIAFLISVGLFLIVAQSKSDWTSSVNIETIATVFTGGSVVFSNGSNLAQDNANLFFDDTNNRLGIGTATPTTDLTIEGGFSIGDTTGFVLAGGDAVGTATVSGESNVILDTGGGAALDTVTTLTGVIGQVVYISTRNSGRDVTFLDAGSFSLGGARVLTNVSDVLVLKATTATAWKEISFANND